MSLFRFVGRATPSTSLRRGTRGQGAVAIVLAASALGAGVVLGAATSPFGGRVQPLSARILGAQAEASAIASWLGLALGVAAAAAGLFAARRDGSRAALVAAASRPARLVEAAGALIGNAARFLARGAVTLDRYVVVDAGAEVTRVVLATARALTAGERAVDARVCSGPIARVALAASSRVGADHPRVASRIIGAAVVVMVALLGLVVLSSLLLG